MKTPLCQVPSSQRPLCQVPSSQLPLFPSAIVPITLVPSSILPSALEPIALFPNTEFPSAIVPKGHPSKDPYAKCLCAKCHSSKCHFPKCHPAKCRSSKNPPAKRLPTKCHCTRKLFHLIGSIQIHRLFEPPKAMKAGLSQVFFKSSILAGPQELVELVSFPHLCSIFCLHYVAAAEKKRKKIDKRIKLFKHLFVQIVIIQLQVSKKDIKKTLTGVMFLNYSN